MSGPFGAFDKVMVQTKISFHHDFHSFNLGDWVTFRGVAGMNGLNGQSCELTAVDLYSAICFVNQNLVDSTESSFDVTSFGSKGVGGILMLADPGTLLEQIRLSNGWRPAISEVLKFKNLCVSAESGSASFSVPRNVHVSYMTWTHKTGQVSCSGARGMSNFGCALSPPEQDVCTIVVTKQGSETNFAPTSEMPGMNVYHENFSYLLAGVTKDSKTMRWNTHTKASRRSELKGEYQTPLVMEAGAYNLWYGEVLAGQSTRRDNMGVIIRPPSIYDNMGVACYDLEIGTVNSFSGEAALAVRSYGSSPSEVFHYWVTCVLEYTLIKSARTTPAATVSTNDASNTDSITCRNPVIRDIFPHVMFSVVYAVEPASYWQRTE